MMSSPVAKAIAVSLVLIVILALFGWMAISDPSGERVTGDSILPTFESDQHLFDFLSGNGKDGLFTPGTAMEGSDGDNQHSGTNIQVEGMDEMDVVKTDGTYIYRANSMGVHVFEAFPHENLTEVTMIKTCSLMESKVENRSIDPQGLFLLEDRLVVVSSLSSIWNATLHADGIGFCQQRGMGLVSVIDVRDRSEPVLLGSWGISGYPITARSHDGHIYLLSQDWLWPDGYLPVILEDDQETTVNGSEVRYDPHSGPTNSYLNLLALDVNSEESSSLSIMMGSFSTIYMSKGSLYLTSLHHGGAIPSSDTGTTSTEMQTIIFRLAIDGLDIEPVDRDQVPGWLLNQFSMDEYEGHLRVVTSTGWSEPENCVIVLDENLNITGSLVGLAPSETVHAARFYGDVLYLVTFERVDPLFVIDMTDPTNPIGLGMLEVPGFSSYLHRLEGNYVMGIGMENSSVKIALYDVTDPRDPVESSRYVVEGYSYSEVNWNHRAILVDHDKDLIVFPVERYDWSSGTRSLVNMVFSYSMTGELSLMEELDLDGSGYWLRSIIIEDVLYSCSTTTIAAHTLPDLLGANILVYQYPSGGWERDGDP
jgi:uncharacterized secreted protein with C-terminal beta-propeller domain